MDAAVVALIDSIAKLDAAALVIIALWGFLSRKIRTEGEMKDERVAADARLAEMRADRDAWKGIADSMGGKVERLTDVVESLVGRKLP